MKNMRCLLKLLGTITLTGLSVIPLAACGGASKSDMTDISKMDSKDFALPTKDIIAKTITAVTPDEIIEVIKPVILNNIKAFTKKDITQSDFTITLAANAQGAPYQALDLSPNASTKTIFIQITSNTKVLGIGHKTEWLAYQLPKATVKLEIPVKNLTKVFATTTPTSTPSSESIIMAINGVNAKNPDWVTLTSNDVDIENINATSATVTGKGDYHQDQITVTFTTTVVKSNLYLIKVEKGKVLSIADVLLVINGVNAKTPDWIMLEEDDIAIKIGDNNNITVTGKGKYQGQITLTYQADIKEVTILSFETDYDPHKTYKDLLTNQTVIAGVIAGINRFYPALNPAINTDFTLALEDVKDPDDPQKIGELLKIKVISTNSSEKMKGSFIFEVKLIDIP